MTCREFTEAVTDYLEGHLSLPLWVGFEMHLGMCPGCPAYFRQVEQAIGALSRLPTPPAPAAVRADLIRRFRVRRQR